MEMNLGKFNVIKYQLKRHIIILNKISFKLNRVLNKINNY